MSELFPAFERFWLGGGPMTSWLSTPWWAADSLASKQLALLRVLSASVSEQLDLAPLVISLAQEHRGRYRRRLYRLARRLAAGTSLPSALEQTPGALSDDQILGIRFGIQSGTLSQVLQAMIKNNDQSSNPIGHRLRQVGFYGAIVSVLFLLVLTFLMIKIIPSFQAIMDDFSIEVTEPLRLLIEIAEFFVNMGPLPLLAAVFCLWLAKSEMSRRFFRRRVLSRVLRPIAQLRSADMLNLLSVVQQAGRPLPGAISTLARYHYDILIRHKLLFVRNEVEQGADLWNSMAQARLLSAAESRALTSSATAGAMTWTMRHLARWKRDRVARRLDTYLDFLLPLVILLMAAVVLFTALATLTPLVKMIGAMA